MELEFSQQIFEKYSNIKFHKNLSSGSRAVPNGLTGMTKLKVAFRNFVNAIRKLPRIKRILVATADVG